MRSWTDPKFYLTWKAEKTLILPPMWASSDTVQQVVACYISSRCLLQAAGTCCRQQVIECHQQWDYLALWPCMTGPLQNNLSEMLLLLPTTSFLQRLANTLRDIGDQRDLAPYQQYLIPPWLEVKAARLCLSLYDDRATERAYLSCHHQRPLLRWPWHLAVVAVKVYRQRQVVPRPLRVA